MEAKANAKFVRISPRKVNVVLDLVRGKDVKYAEAVLKHTPKAACEPLLKLLNSAMANAENNHDMDVSKLYIAQCNATAGPILKRIRPRAQGRAFRINKRTSHISLVLKEREDDYNLRKTLKAQLYNFGISKIEIERDGKKVKISIHCAKPGLVIGKGGSEIEKLRAQCEKMLGKPVAINIVEVKAPELDAQLVAESIAQQLEKRISFRRAMKMSIGNAMRRGAKGIKIMCSGRLGGAEIARSEQYHEGTIPLQTLRADIDYGFAEANTTYGKVGVKVWLYKGEVLNEVKSRKPRREGGRK